MSSKNKKTNGMTLDISEYISASELKERGWTASIIKKLMPLSDNQLPNPYFPNAAPMKLYLLKRVKMVESSNEFVELTQKSSRQANVLIQCFTKKRDALTGLATMLEIPNFYITEDHLLKKALLEVNIRGISKTATKESVLHDQKMIAIDMLIEMQGPVLWVFDPFYQHQGIREARQIIRRRVLAKIISTYPSLKDEALARAIEENGDV